LQGSAKNHKKTPEGPSKTHTLARMDVKGVTKALRRGGLMADPAGTKELASLVNSLNIPISVALAKVKSYLTEVATDGKMPVLTVQHVTAALKETPSAVVAEETEHDEREDDVEMSVSEVGSVPVVRVVSALEQPKVRFQGDSHRLTQTEMNGLNMKGNFFSSSCSDKALMMLNRYHLVHQRLIRNPLFQTSIVDVQFNPGAKKFEIIPVASLISLQQGELCCLFGLLDEIGDGCYSLEDTSGSIELDLSQCELAHGIIFPGCFVLVEGKRRTRTLEVVTIGLPPAEPRNETLTIFPHFRPRKLRQTEGMVLMFSDACLSDSSVRFLSSHPIIISCLVL
jgi:hypothetical protein